MASFTVNPAQLAVSSTANIITLVGTGTTWSGTPFTISGGTGASITAQTVTDNTHASITVSAGSATGTLTVSDGTNTAPITVLAATTYGTATMINNGSGTATASSLLSQSSYTTSNGTANLIYDYEFTGNFQHLDIEAAGGTTDLYISVDGAAETLYVYSSNVYKSIADSLTSGEHSVRIRGGASIVNVRLAGGTQAVTSTSNMAFPTVITTPSGYTAPAGSAVVSSYGNNRVSSGILFGYQQSIFEFTFTGVRLEALLSNVQSGDYLEVQIDGGSWTYPQGNPTVSNALTGWNMLADGLTAGSHTAKVLVGKGTTGAGTTRINTFRVRNGTRLTSSASSGQNQIVVDSVSNISNNDWLNLDNGSGVYEFVQVSSISGTTITLTNNLAYNHNSHATVWGYKFTTPTAGTSSDSRTKGYVAIGDSITAAQEGGAYGYIDYWDSRFSYFYKAMESMDAVGYNFGIPGKRSDQMAPNSDISLYVGVGSNPTPKAWIIEAGTNDLAQNVTGTTFTTNYTALVQRIETLAGTTVPIYLVAIFSPLVNVSTPNSVGLKVGDYNNLISAIATSEQGRGYNVIYVSNLTAGLNLTAGADITADGTHLSDTGSTKFAANLVSLLNPLPTTPTGFSGSTPVGAVTLSWNSVTGATGYRVYIDGSSTASYDLATTSVIDYETSGTTHTYQVTAYSVAGESAKSSPPISVTFSGGGSGSSGGYRGYLIL